MHCREIPSSLNNRLELHSSKFYTIITMVCACLHIKLKKNKNPVTLLSLIHTTNLVTAEEFKNPLAILDYNQGKDDVDRFDGSLEEFSCRRKTVR